MVTEIIDRPTDAHGCKCESQIADLQSRLGALERLLDFTSAEPGLAAEIMRHLKTSDGRSLIVDHVTRGVSNEPLDATPSPK